MAPLDALLKLGRGPHGFSKRHDTITTPTVQASQVSLGIWGGDDFFHHFPGDVRTSSLIWKE
jgi:hypothetical protein